MASHFAIQALRYALGVRRYEFDGGLAPYNLNAWRQWQELTSCLDQRVIDAIQPVGVNICTEAAEAMFDEQGSDGGDGEAGERPQTEAEARLRRQLMVGSIEAIRCVMLDVYMLGGILMLKYHHWV